ncbi:MAG: hypothetical protein H0V60_00010 [Actinobacteria bacterium]|nr:hypothetical protein [Actinomycetota bacterium]
MKPNFICRPYRGVSVQEITSPLEGRALRDYLIGRPVYRRTEFMVMVNDGRRAVVQVAKASLDPLFSPVTDLHYLAGPDDVAFVDDDTIDTANATQMAQAAIGSGMSAEIYVVQGRFQHVNFIYQPAPVRVQVIEVIPPEPPKLLEMARKVVDFDEDLPPIELELVPIDLRTLASGNGAAHYLFPCRCAGLDLDAAVDFLDAGPERLEPWTMVGCERSRQIHESFYGVDPEHRIDICPKVINPPTNAPTLTKCCLLERGTESSEGRMVVPWGASLDEVRAALHDLVDLEQAREGMRA